MAVEIKGRVCDGYLFKWLVEAAVLWLEHHHHKVNQMNVFPVPDGDTGTNMLLTMRKACGEVAYMNEPHVGVVSMAVAKGALMGARGNSGVILSQLWHGFAEGLRGHEAFDGALLARACQSAVDAAYKSVVTPVEGTILTVAREAVEAVVAHARTEQDLPTLLEDMVEAANKALLKTPDLLPVLKEAGVVDSGGMGLTFILEGMLRFLRGEVVDMQTSTQVSANGKHWQQALVPEDVEGYGYDVQFLMHGSDMDVAAVRAAIDAMGWSTLVVGDPRLIKVHVHVHDPGKPISFAIGLGAVLDDVVVENMQQQYHQYVENRIARESDGSQPINGVAVVVVASGDGLRRLFLQDLHAAHVISGGQTMNPSTEDFLKAMDTLPNQEIILLPNNKNILMAAKQAASMTQGRRVQVIPTRTIPQGISAMMAYVNLYESASMDDLTAAMQEAVNQVTTGEVTTAVRDSLVDGVTVHEGQWIGILDGKLVFASDSLEATVRHLLQKAHADEHELITLYYGDSINADRAQTLANDLFAEFAKPEIVVVEGGQALYPYIISVE